MVDVQEKLVPTIVDWQTVVQNCRRVLEAAGAFDVPVIATEQYPKGLGPTVAPLRRLLGSAALPSKKTFSCVPCLSRQVQDDDGRDQLVVVGIETHVCVLQTVLELLAMGLRVHVVVDAVGSRGRLDHEVALRQMEQHGAVPTTTEIVLFQWCRTADDARFPVVRRLVTEPDRPLEDAQ
ncbi:MAG: hydrolase [Planctomycetota bacterium]|nr:MAG: hydrolase [Planctomycetota bacterium]